MGDKTIVIDNGTGSIYAGFADDDNYASPLVEFPNFTGYSDSGLRQVNFSNFSDPQKYHQFVNDVKNGDTKISYSMENGKIVDWDGMENVWEYTFKTALSAKPEECNLLITEPTLNSKPNRESMGHVLFEKFDFPALSIVQSGILPLYSAGLTTGVVLDIGDGIVQTVPVWGGYPISEAVDRADFGGRDITDFLGRLLRDKGYASKPLEILKLIKENIGYVLEKNMESKQPQQSSYKLPDGEEIKLDSEAYHCTELLFNPSAIDNSDKIGVHEMLYKSIMRTNMGIVISGGSTLFEGFSSRISAELKSLLPQKAKITIRAAPDRKYATWRGASVLASLSNFGALLISKQEFEEVGPSILHKNK